MGNIISNFLFVNAGKSSYDELPGLIMINDRVPTLILKYSQDSPTLLVSHGNAYDIGTLDMYSMSIQTYCNIVVYDYCGYGVHPVRTPSEDGCNEDISQVFDYLVTRLKVKPSSIFLYGESVGSGPTCYLAKELTRQGVRIGGIILVSPFESCVRVVSRSISLFFDMFKNYKLAPEIDQKVLLIHGMNDKIVNPSHSKNLYELFTCKKELLLIPDANHNNLRFFQEYTEAIFKFTRI